MRNGQSGRRRGRGGARPPSAGNSRTPDLGNRIEVRQRGNAHQMLEKYKALARDATMQGDRVSAEYFFQYADHYYRVLNYDRARQDDFRGRERERETYDYDAAPTAGDGPAEGPGPGRSSGERGGQEERPQAGFVRQDRDRAGFDRGQTDRDPQDRGPDREAMEQARAERAHGERTRRPRGRRGPALDDHGYGNGAGGASLEPSLDLEPELKSFDADRPQSGTALAAPDSGSATTEGATFGEAEAPRAVRRRGPRRAAAETDDGQPASPDRIEAAPASGPEGSADSGSGDTARAPRRRRRTKTHPEDGTELELENV